MVIDHIMHDLIETQFVLRGFYMEKSPFFIFGMSLEESRLFFGHLELQAEQFSSAEPLQVAFKWQGRVVVPDSGGPEHYLKYHGHGSQTEMLKR